MDTDKMKAKADLAALSDKHCECEFTKRGVEGTMATMVAIVTFEGNKIANEHIYWDQASVLVQIGLLDPQNLPVTGTESARKVLDKTLPSNELITRKNQAKKNAAPRIP